ncbi:GDSL esterase/lipase At1g28590-like [Lolium rigidum]|uniref:GDSL esterase/lipase At1g28590-like n=1 Tax=Lolium rigidum TaxID=89674 RepID=UPI001F5D3882|nr:GDSL esterase/lipase At1g28590-like [Lolium rigidum]
MASSASMSVVAVVLVLAAAQPARADRACYTRVFSFGDSLTDTGNYGFVFPDSNGGHAPWPYGETYFHQATGRSSNGRLIVDFIADALGLPFVPPYWGGHSAEYFAGGANFAVAQATALSPEFLRENGVTVAADTVHLDMEMDWFRDLLKQPNLLCPNDFADCSSTMKKSLFLVGEIGGNDYNGPFLSKMPIEMIRNLTPSVVAKISATITDLIGLGAKTLLVPGNLPIGCVPIYLMTYKSDKKEDYESLTGCLRLMNEFSKYHNRYLLDELDKLRNLHSGVSIIYADYYGAAMEVFLSPKKFGIDYPLVACCGGEGFYGVSTTERCGNAEYRLCDDPQKYGSWDGLHPSEAVYKGIVNGLLRGSYTQPPIANSTNSCPQLTRVTSDDEDKVFL